MSSFGSINFILFCGTPRGCCLESGTEEKASSEAGDSDHCFWPLQLQKSYASHMSYPFILINISWLSRFVLVGLHSQKDPELQDGLDQDHYEAVGTVWLVSFSDLFDWSFSSECIQRSEDEPVSSFKYFSALSEPFSCSDSCDSCIFSADCRARRNERICTPLGSTSWARDEMPMIFNAFVFSI